MRVVCVRRGVKLVIAGGPRTGKTTLANKYRNVAHTDALIPYGWKRASEIASAQFDDPDIEVQEGVASLRALRKWLRANKTGKPCDKLIYLTHPFEELTPGQKAMTKGCHSVFRQVRPYLESRGVIIETP